MVMQQPAGAQSTGTASVVFIEDDADVRKMMDNFLGRHYRVRTYSDGNEALDAIRTNPPDVIISDVTMPTMSGYELLGAIREGEATALVPFIFLTAQAEYENLRQGMAHGADDYLTKPVSVEDVHKAIEAQLQKQQVKRERIEATMRIVRESLTYSLPHELRTPLFQIIGYVDMLKMGYDDLDEDSTMRFLDGIAKASDRMHRLVENYSVHLQLEGISRDESRQEALRNHILRNAAVTIQQVVDTLGKQYDRGDDIEARLEPHVLRISDQNLAKIVYEFLDNALKFSRKGQVIAIGSLVRDGAYHLVMRDAGEGMTSKQVQQVGEPFLQFERERWEQRGVGLGFSIAQRLVTFHEGQLSVQSKPGVGTRIHVRLPIA